MGMVGRTIRLMASVCDRLLPVPGKDVLLMLLAGKGSEGNVRVAMARDP